MKKRVLIRNNRYYIPFIVEISYDDLLYVFYKPPYHMAYYKIYDKVIKKRNWRHVIGDT